MTSFDARIHLIGHFLLLTEDFMKPRLIFLKALVLVFSAASLTSIAAMLPNRLLGDPAPPTAAARTIVVDSNTRHVRVEGGETIKFVVGGNAFTWHFNGPEGPFDLRQIVPAGTLDHKIVGYVEANPLYRGN